jgi:hypothetical protein
MPAASRVGKVSGCGSCLAHGETRHQGYRQGQAAPPAVLLVNRTTILLFGNAASRAMCECSCEQRVEISTSSPRRGAANPEEIRLSGCVLARRPGKGELATPRGMWRNRWVLPRRGEGSRSPTVQWAQRSVRFRGSAFGPRFDLQPARRADE